MAFVRKVGSGDDVLLMVANADGSNVAQLTPDPLQQPFDMFYWSPDGTSIALSSGLKGRPTIQLVHTDGSGVDVLETGMPSVLAGWKPAQGTELLFRGTSADGAGLYLVPVGGGAPTLVLAGLGHAPDSSKPITSLQNAGYSPDGSRLVYSSQAPARGHRPCGGIIHLMNADSSGIIAVHVLDADYEDWASWSPDGTFLSVLTRTGGSHQMAFVPVDGTGPVVSPEPRTDPNGMGQAWSADGTQVLTWRVADNVISTVDTATGASTDMPWRSDANPDWQRKAPFAIEP